MTPLSGQRIVFPPAEPPAKNEETPPLPTTKYKVILADPPWQFKVRSDKGKGRSAEAHYDCMSFADICFLRAGERWAAENCVLFMWTTDPMLKQALQVIDAWGFEYKTVGFTWVKGRMNAQYKESDLRPFDRLLFPIGCGYWTRSNPEICLLAVRGKPKRVSKSVRQLIVSPRREHSRKPDETYGLIEQLCEGPYLELFARQRHSGWDTALSPEVDTGPAERRWSSVGHPALPLNPYKPPDDLAAFLD